MGQAIDTQVVRCPHLLDRVTIATPARKIDKSVDVRADSGGRDPDKHSPTLRRYHQLIWSKLLPGGADFNLNQVGPYLHHHSQLGEFWLSSDSVIATFVRHRSMAAVTSQFSADILAEFDRVGYTIGGMMVFQAQRIDKKLTINGARGLHPKIKDRMDLTLECIRRHYSGQVSPLAATLARYADFFSLFSDFDGYVDFFLLNDLTDLARCGSSCRSTTSSLRQPRQTS